MQPPRYITPGLGGKSLLVLVVWAGVSLAVPLAVDPNAYFPRSWQALARLGCLMGITFGFGSGLTWVATTIGNPIIRVIVRILIVAAFGYVLSFLGTADWIRHAVNLTGLLLAQSIWFSWLRVPDWMIARRKTASIESLDSGQQDWKQAPRHQFQIADLVALTTGFACLLGLVIRYVAPAEGRIYWSLLLLIWSVTPVIAACFVFVSLARFPDHGKLGKLLGIILCVLLAAILSYAESLVSSTATSLTEKGILNQLGAVPCFYGLFFLCYAATLYLFGLAGRIQTSWRDEAGGESSQPEAMDAS